MSNNKKIRVGIVGVGGIANGVHIPGYLQSQNSIITAICDIDKGALEGAAKRCNVSSEFCFSDYKELIACKEVDVVHTLSDCRGSCQTWKAILCRKTYGYKL